MSYALTSPASPSPDARPQKRVLIVEDEPDIAELIGTHVDGLADAVTIVDNGDDAIRLGAAGGWALIVLDLQIPGPDGLAVCRAVRRSRPYQPIIMLTSRASELDRVLGLETGADDYLTKPFSILEFAARVKALFRRIENLPARDAVPATATPLVAGDLVIDPLRRRVSRNAQAIELTAREFDLLLFFARHPGRVFRRSELLDAVWGLSHEGYEHTVNSHINRLRAKVEYDPANPRIIETVWGVGYRVAVWGETPCPAASG